MTQNVRFKMILNEDSTYLFLGGRNVAPSYSLQTIKIQFSPSKQRDSVDFIHTRLWRGSSYVELPPHK